MKNQSFFGTALRWLTGSICLMSLGCGKGFQAANVQNAPLAAASNTAPGLASVLAANPTIILTFKSAAQSVAVGKCSSLVTLELANGTTPVTFDGFVGLPLAASGANTSLYYDAACSQTANIITLNGSSATAQFYFRGNAAGSVSISAGLLGLQTATQAESITSISSPAPSPTPSQSPAPAPSPTPTPTPTPTTGAVNQFAPVAVWGGGYAVGMDFAADGTHVIRTDTYGAYIFNGTQWQQLLTSNSMPPNTFFLDANGNFMNPQGVYELRIAPSNTNIFYMMYDGYVFKTQNRGGTWTETAFPIQAYNPDMASQNDNYRTNQQKMAVDPSNASIVYVGTPKNGMYVTKDGGATWSAVSSVPASIADGSGIYPGVTGIVFDPSSGTTGGATNTIYASSYGHGVYQSTNAGSTWVHLSGSPLVVEGAVVGSGAYYCGCAASSGSSANALMKFASGSWSTLITDSNGVHAVTIDPFSSTHIVYGGFAPFLNQSNDGGKTWYGNYWYNNAPSSYSDDPWMAYLNAAGPGGGTSPSTFMSAGNLMFDPLAQNKLWLSHGNGVYYTETLMPPYTQTWTTPIDWIDQTAGITNMVARVAISPPGGHPVLSFEDRQEFVITNPAVPPSTFGIGGQPGQEAGWSVAYAATSPSTVVALNSWDSFNYSGYSSNYGQSWTAFGAPPTSVMGGMIAASTATNFVAMSSNDPTNAVYTTNAGASWSAASGLPTSGWPTSLWNNTQAMTADSVVANKFYLYNGSHGLYTSTNGGATWTLTNSEIIDPEYFEPTLKAVPNQAGALYYTSGITSGTQPTTVPLYRTSNGGATWSTVPNVESVWAIGFGAPAPLTDVATIWVVGWVNQGSGYKYGIWVSKDSASTWTWLTDYPYGHFDEIVTITGDMNDPTKCYFGFQGSSYGYGYNLQY